MNTTTLFSCHKQKKVYIAYSREEKEKMPHIEKWGILNGYSSQEENARKDVLGLTAVVTFFFPQIPSFFIYQRQKMGLAYCFFNSLCSPIILCWQAFQNSFVSISCSTSHPSVPEMKLVFLMNNFLFLLWRWWAIFPPTASNLDKVAHIPRLYSLHQISNMFRKVTMLAHGNWG